VRPLFLLVSGGALTTAAAVFFGYRKAEATKNAVIAATGGDAAAATAAAKRAQSATTLADVKAAAAQVQAAATAAPPSSPDVIAAANKAVQDAQSAVTPADVKDAAVQVQDVADKMTGNTSISLRLTGYWPMTAKSGEQAMEGGVHDRKGRPLHTVEDFFSGKSDHASLSGDDSAWPYGQKLLIPWVDGQTLVGRVTDTGGSFRGANKRYRIVGDEPIDVCVFSKTTKVPTEVTAQIVRGDTLDKPGRDIVSSKFQGQTVVGGLNMLGAA
jgi:hypothetical protein